MSNIDHETYRCSVCRSTDVQVCKPAFFEPNNGWKYVEEDGDADALSTFCNDCGEDQDLVVTDGDGFESPYVGRWSLS